MLLQLPADASLATAQSDRRVSKTGVVLELTIKEVGGETRKPRLTVELGGTGIADFDDVGKLGLRPTAVREARDVTITILDASVNPMKELEEVLVRVNSNAVAVKSRPALSIGVLRVFDVK